ncbi:hypothetical protein LSAT2_013527 [Lamellibrachia satsuma]|nr:hypothetical protein LSAT2_013527 [Lamellibrachia satsuma]
MQNQTDVQQPVYEVVPGYEQPTQRQNEPRGPQQPSTVSVPASSPKTLNTQEPRGRKRKRLGRYCCGFVLFTVFAAIIASVIVIAVVLSGEDNPTAPETEEFKGEVMDNLEYGEATSVTQAPPATHTPPATEALPATEAPPATHAPPATQTLPAAQAPPVTQEPSVEHTTTEEFKGEVTDNLEYGKATSVTQAPPATHTPPATEALPATEAPPATHAPPATQTLPATQAPPVTQEPSVEPTRTAKPCKSLEPPLHGAFARDAWLHGTVYPPDSPRTTMLHYSSVGLQQLQTILGRRCYITRPSGSSSSRQSSDDDVTLLVRRAPAAPDSPRATMLRYSSVGLQQLAPDSPWATMLHYSSVGLQQLETIIGRRCYITFPSDSSSSRPSSGDYVTLLVRRAPASRDNHRTTMLHYSSVGLQQLQTILRR